MPILTLQYSNIIYGSVQNNLLYILYFILPILISTSTSSWVTTSRRIITAMLWEAVKCASDKWSDICTTILPWVLERTQPITTSIWIIFAWVLTILCISTGAQTMPIVAREPFRFIVSVTWVAHITIIRWTTQLNTAFVRTASSMPPEAQDQFIRHCPLDISSPAIFSARFIDNLKLKC